MNKILVTTDFSSNSKAGLRFAIQLATQHSYELSFFHSYYIMKPTSWTEAKFLAYEKNEEAKIQNKLNQFVESIYKYMGVSSNNPRCIIRKSLSNDKNIIEYAEINKFSLICIATRGAGKLKKIFGTNTSRLISHTTIPVVVIPENYRTTKIKNILYASDLDNLQNELKQVMGFAEAIKAKVELLHFSYPMEVVANKRIIQEIVKQKSGRKIKLHLESVDLDGSLVENISKAIKEFKPSMMIMFTQRSRSLFDKIFLPSESIEYTFNAKVPLLVFTKN